MNRKRGWNMGWDERWDNAYYYNSNREYIMTTEGLDEINRGKTKPRNRSGIRNNEERPGMEGNNDTDDDGGGYRYKGNKSNTPEKRDSVKTVPKDSVKPIKLPTASIIHKKPVSELSVAKSEAHPIFNLLSIFQ